MNEVTDIPSFFGVESDSVKDLIKGNIDLFKKDNKVLISFKIGGAEYKLIENYKDVVWQDVRLDSRYIEMLLMFFKDSEKAQKYMKIHRGE